MVIFGPWSPPYGGVAIHVQALTQTLRAQGFAVRALCYGEFTRTPQVTRISPLREGWTRTLWRLFLSVSSRTLFHDHSGFLGYPDERLIRSLHAVIRFKQARWILTLHDETLLERFPAWPESVRALYCQWLQWPAHILCVGDRLQDFLIGLGVSREKLTSISPLLPLREGPASSLPSSVRTFLAAHAPLITTIGTFDSNYDFLTVANAFACIRQERPAAGLVLIDAGFTVDISYRAAVIQLLKKLPGHSYMVLSRVPHDHVLQILRESAVLIRGVRRESFGLSRVEAILMGTPVVTTDAGETHYMTLYQCGNPEDLAQKVLVVLERKPDLADAQAFFRKMGEETLTRILDVYERQSADRNRR